jgi:hypothetical protein
VTSLARFTTDLATTTTTQPGNSETVRPSGSHYLVNWHTDNFNLNTAITYRISVSVGGHCLGDADVDVVGLGKDLKNVDTQQFIGLVDGRTLPVDFTIEQGALAEPSDPACGSALVTISGKVTNTGTYLVCEDAPAAPLEEAVPGSGPACPAPYAPLGYSITLDSGSSSGNNFLNTIPS